MILVALLLVSQAGGCWWSLKLGAVFASVEAHSGIVIVLLRSPWFCCEIMSFGALELWRVGRLNTLYCAAAHMPIDCFE